MNAMANIISDLKDLIGVEAIVDSDAFNIADPSFPNTRRLPVHVDAVNPNKGTVTIVHTDSGDRSAEAEYCVVELLDNIGLTWDEYLSGDFAEEVQASKP